MAQEQMEQRRQRKQLSAGMEHMRAYVAIEPTAEANADTVETSVYGVPGSLVQPVRRPKSDRPENAQKRTDPFQFGSRLLEEGDNIFEFNAWDHVEVDEGYKAFAEQQYEMQRQERVGEMDKKVFMLHPSRFWNRFYTSNTTNFFKDRKWLAQEFPILTALTTTDAPPAVILEVGAGAGNTAFPIRKLNQNPGLRIHACDFSRKAVELIKGSEAFRPEAGIGSIEASVWDIASPPNPDTQAPSLPEGLAPGSVDVVILIFIFSALAPEQWTQALWNVWHVLRPGGVVLFRDYGRGDLAQVRFKKGRYLDENFYVRGDGTRVYFFDEDELKGIWSGASVDEGATNKAEGRIDQSSRQAGDGETESNDIIIGTAKLSVDKANTTTSETPSEQSSKTEGTLSATSPLESSSNRPDFSILDFGVDRRMLVNRQRKLKMYRCWMQAKFRKPLKADTTVQKGDGHGEDTQDGMTAPTAIEVLAQAAAAERMTGDQSIGSVPHESGTPGIAPSAGSNATEGSKV